MSLFALRCSARTEVTALAAGVFLVYWALSWTRPLGVPDEARYAEIPREMVASGDWIVPRLNGVLYFYKPPLVYWLHGIALWVAGPSTMALRFWPAALAAAGGAAVHLAGRRLYDRRTGLLAALVLTTSPLYAALGQILLLDMALSVLMAAGLLCWVVGVGEPEAGRRRRLALGAWGFLGLAVMAKGLVAVVLPAAIVLAWMALVGGWRQAGRMQPVAGPLLFLGIALPWHLAVGARHHPEWFRFYVVHEHFLRYLTPVSERVEPWWYFLAILPVALLPWSLLLPWTARDAWARGFRDRAAHPETCFLALWALAVVGFFSASSSKLIPYLLPALPPLALLTARSLASLAPGPLEARWRRFQLASAGLLAALGAGLVGAAWLRMARGRVDPAAFPWLALAGALMVATGGLALARLRPGRRVGARGFVAIAACAIALFNPLAGAFQRPSTAAAARFLKPLLTPDDSVYHFPNYFQDLPFYLERLTGVVDDRPLEQRVGLGLEDHSARYLDAEALRERWHSGARAIVVAKAEEAPKLAGLSPLHEWYRDRHFVVYANRPRPPR